MYPVRGRDTHHFGRIPSVRSRSLGWPHPGEDDTGCECLQVGITGATLGMAGHRQIVCSSIYINEET